MGELASPSWVWGLPLAPVTMAGAESEMLARVRASGAEIVIGAFSQPRGELRVAENSRATGASTCFQIGASLDFAAGRVRLAPVWARCSGLEWMCRLALEPRRLAVRYARNAAFLIRSVARDRFARMQARPAEVTL